jgi:hypothetical protein
MWSIPATLPPTLALCTKSLITVATFGLNAFLALIQTRAATGERTPQARLCDKVISQRSISENLIICAATSEKEG